jgi:NADH-quinone oxidoreductase subunit I
MDTGMHMTALDNRASFIYDKEKLMSIPGQDGSFKTANPRHEPGDPTHPGITRLHRH